MHWLVIVGSIVVLLSAIIPIMLVINGEMRDRQAGASNESGYALIAIMMIIGLVDIFTLVFLLVHYLDHK
ncbi:MAG: hypothetical protein AAB649_07140 [Patescibacteria group bacterium]